MTFRFSASGGSLQEKTSAGRQNTLPDLTNAKRTCGITAGVLRRGSTEQPVSELSAGVPAFLTF